MIPIWAHAYSHRMMTSYQCEEQVIPLSSGIRDAINTVNAEYPKIIMFDGEIALVQDKEIDELQYTKKQIGCWLYSSSKNRTDMEENQTDMQVFILVERDMYRYINPSDKGQRIRFLKNDIDIDKTQWFNELFPEMNIQTYDDSDLLDEFGVKKKTIDITNMDLTFDTSEDICEIYDSLNFPLSSLTVEFQGKEIDTMQLWFKLFLEFYLKWRSEIEIQQLEQEFLRDFEALDEKAKEMVMAVKEYREILDMKVSSEVVEVDPSDVEINIDDGESKVGDVSDVDEPEIDKNDSDEADDENPDEETETDTDESNTEPQQTDTELEVIETPKVIQEKLDNNEPVVTCIDTENGTQVGKSYKSVSGNTVTHVRGSEKSTVLRPSPNFDAVLTSVVPANEEFANFEANPPSVEWETVDDSIRCSNECVELVDTDPSEYSQALTEFVPQPENAKEWKREIQEKDGSVGNGSPSRPSPDAQYHLRWFQATHCSSTRVWKDHQ